MPDRSKKKPHSGRPTPKGPDGGFRSEFAAIGEPEAKLGVNISYDIIQQFSTQLYTNPRKAIEELVCNSYDAGAKECHISIPKEEGDPLVLLDNGRSMDVEGLVGLWMVASSPKARTAGERIDNNRLQIGKFGVGKLAAYALGNRLTHIACIDGVARLVSVGQEQLKGVHRGPRFQIFKATERSVRSIVGPLLGSLPKPWERHWRTWTIAIVEDVARSSFERALKIGRLRQMLSTALPVHSEFSIFLDGARIVRARIPRDAIQFSVNVLNLAFRAKLRLDLREYWSKELNIEKGDVPAELYEVKVGDMPDPLDVRKTVKAIFVPRLGFVEGEAIFARDTLTPEKLNERGYANNGYHIFAHGKLVNPEDELFGVTQRSHGFWRRFQARVEMPGLDDVLLVQRNAVSENSTKAQLAREFVRVLFNFVRKRAQDEEEKDDKPPRSFGAKLRKVSPLLAPLALQGLAKGEMPQGGVAAVEIDFASLREDGPASQYDAASNAIQINQDHPIIAALDELGEAAQKQWRRVVAELTAGYRLTIGLLAAKGVPGDVVVEVEEFIDAALRSAASYIRDPVEDHIHEIQDASYEGGDKFEAAVVNAFRSLGLVARHIGGADNPDGTVDIPKTGDRNLRISIEAKGSKGVISHEQLSVSTVSRHQQEAGSTSAVAIAREFQEKGAAGRRSALMREATNLVPLLTVDGIARLLRLHRQRPFTYDKIEKILTTFKPPSLLPAFIEEQWRELPELGLMRDVLTVAHEKAADDDQNFPDPGMLIGDMRVKKHKVKKGDVVDILNAVAVTTGMIIIMNRSNHEFKMLAPVATILDAMQAAAKEEVDTGTPDGSAPNDGAEKTAKPRRHRRGQGKI